MPSGYLMGKPSEDGDLMRVYGGSMGFYRIYHLVINWLVASIPLKNMKVRLDHLDHHPSYWGNSGYLLHSHGKSP